MRVLQVINSLATGGAEKLLLDLLPLYHRRGITIDLLLLNGNEYPFLEQLRTFDCCKIHTLGHSSVYNPLNALRLIPFFKKYDLVHVHLFPSLYWVGLAKFLSRSTIKLVFTEHNTSNRRIDNSFFKIIDRVFYRAYERIICITESIMLIMQKHTGFEYNTFNVIENGVNLDLVESSLPYDKREISPGIDSTDFLLIQVAGFREQKDQNTLIKSLLYIPNDVKLILVGDGVLRQSSEALVHSLGLSNRVFFLGLRIDVFQLIKTVDVVVLSSKYEGLSLSSIEGMASGKPFLASDVPGLSNLVGNAGILFKQGDEKELALHINSLRNDKEYYTHVVRSCLKRAANFNIKTTLEAHIKLYNELY